MFRKRTFVYVLLLLYIIPFFIQAKYSDEGRITGLFLGLPTTQTGDEPHYYITLYSLVNDGDIFLTNNYNNAFFRNGSDLGRKKLSYENRHTRIFDTPNKRIISMPFIDETRLNLSYVPAEDSKVKEISGHPIGLPIFAFIFLWPFTNTSFLEHVAIFLTLVFSLLGILAFYRIMMFYHKNEKKTILFTALFAFATQYWHYSKTFWAEPYLASFAIISWYLIIVQKTYFIPGLLLGFGFLMKFPFALVILPFISYLAYKRQFKSLMIFSAPLSLSLASALYINYYFTNNIFAFNQVDAVSFIFPLHGIYNWLFSSSFGLLTFSPVLIFSLLGIKELWKKNKEQTIVIVSTILLYFLFWTSYIIAQNGVGGYSARYLLPIIPFLTIFCSFYNFEKSKIKQLFYVLLTVSLVINFCASFFYPAFTGYSISISFGKIFNDLFEIIL